MSDGESQISDGNCENEDLINTSLLSDMEIQTENNTQNTLLENEEVLRAGRSGKRSRDEDNEEQWISVARGGKKFLRSTGIENSIRIPEERIEVCITGKEKLPKQIGLAKTLKSLNISGIIRIKFLNAYKVYIQFNSEENADNMIKSSYWEEKGYRCQKTFEVGVSYGVIRDIELELTDEEILKSLSSEKEIINIKRLKRRNFDDGNWELCELVRICFKGPSLPTHVLTHDIRAVVEPYIFPVTQCSRCWKFGHNQRLCPSNRIICPKCSQNHPNCETTTYKCSNCSGKHLALAKICPMFLKEKRIREIMSEFNCTYRKALTLYVPPSPPVHTVNEHVHKPNVYAPMPDTQPNRSPTYAEKVKTTAIIHQTEPQGQNINRKPNKKSHYPKKTTNNKERKGVEHSEEESSIVSGDEVTKENIEENTLNKSKIQELLRKLREVIFESRLSIGEKIKNSFKLTWDWIISLAVKMLAEWPIFKSFLDHNGQ
ncbi:unnamed protein product [Plutella xylostella]|uniref:(diamondback moth) hypothetical protein n=1 Tax=Plutella xylostella TaxID=51655 RepID=A0A8S4DMQ4_PLUXY|nr:unnamed protein product [Plutella xylostella]